MPARRRPRWAEDVALDPAGHAQQDIVDELRRVILDGVVPPGSPIPVSEVADRFGVSAIPVRESLKTLTAEGLVTHLPNVGFAVARLTAGELAELYLVRESLESTALAVSVERASDADRAQLVEINRLLEQAVAQDDPVAYHRQSRQFHLALTRPSGMSRLLHLLEYAWNITEPVQAMVHIGPEQRAALHADHHEMVAAFMARDVDRLLAASTEHHHRLNRVVAALPRDSRLIAEE